MNENLEKYSQNYLHNRQQNQYENNYSQQSQQHRQYSQPIEQSRHQNNKEQYDIKQIQYMLQQSQEHNENLKNIIDDLKKQIREYKHKFEQSSKENEQLKSQNKLQNEKNEIYIMRINTFEQSEQNLKQKVSDLSSKYEYLKGKYQEISKKCKWLETQNQSLQQYKKESDQNLYKPENRVQTNPGNDESPNNLQSVSQGVNSRQQIAQQNKSSLKKISSIDLGSQGGSIQDIDKYAFQILKQQQNHSQNSLTPQNQNTKQVYPRDAEQNKLQNNFNSYTQINDNKVLAQESSLNKLPVQSPRSYSQIEGNNQNNVVNGVQMLKNNYINQMQSVNNNQTPIRNSTSVPALFRTAKTESQHAENINDMKTSPINLQKKNNEILPSNYQTNQVQKGYSDNKQPQNKSLLFPQQNNSSIYQQEDAYASLNKYQNTGALDNPNEQSNQKLVEANYQTNIHQKPPIIKKMDLVHNQSQFDQQRQNDICVAYGRINSHRATADNLTPTNSSNQNLNTFESQAYQTKNMQQIVAAIPQVSNQSVTYLGDQSTLSNSLGQGSQQYMSQSSKNSFQQQNTLASSQGPNGNKSIQQNNLSIGSYYPSNPSSYDISYSESNFTSNQNYQSGNKDMYSSLNSRNLQNKSQLNDAHMYSTNPVQTTDYNSTNQYQQNRNIQISQFNKNTQQNNSSSKLQSSNNGYKAQSVTEFNHQLPKYIQGDYEKSNPQSETKIDSEIHTPQKPNIFQSKSVFNNNQISTFQSANVNQSSVIKENDFAEHLISNEAIQIKKRSQVLHASRRDPNTNGQYSPTSSSNQKLSQYEDKQLMKALFGNDNTAKESGIPLTYSKNQDKMFELSQRVENEFDLNKQNDRVVPSLNPNFPQNNNSLSNSSNNSYNQSQIEKRSQSIKNIASNQLIDADSMSNLDSTNDNRQKLRTSERNNNNLKTIQISPFGQSSIANIGQKPQKMAKLIENFIVISANQEKTRQLSKQNVFNVDQEIIFRAAEPKNEMENEQHKVISKFCFPQGVEVHKYKRENFSSDIQKMINTHKELQSKEYFVFPIKSAESFEKKANNQLQTALDQQEGIDDIMNPNKFLYCVCIIARDYIDPISAQQRMFKSENNNQTQHYYQVSSIYCIITKYPFFNFFFELILQFINKMNINKKNHLTEFQPKNMLPSASDFQQIDLSSFKKHVNQGVLKIIQSCIKGEIGIDFNIVHKFSLGQELLSLNIPQKDYCYLLEAKWGVMQTLTIMNVYEFLYILFSMLLEESLVFLSKNPSTLSQTMMMFLSALKPFKWPHPFVMFLSNDLMHMFDSPFPLVIGINKSYDFIKDNKLYKTHSHCIFVNLDEFGISEKKESIYQSSTYSSLTSKIKGDYEQLKQLFNKKDAYNDFSQQLFDISNTIYDKIRKFFKDTLHKILPSKPILDSKNHLDYDLMKTAIQKNCSQGDQFIEKFIQSQIFSYYMEEHYNL